MSIRILLVDESNLFRKGLAALISSLPDVAVVGDVRSGREAEQACLQMEPTIVLMDIMLAGVNGLDTIVRIKRRQPEIRVVLLTTLKTEDYVRAALRVGADGYVLKDATLEELQMSLRSVSMGKKYLSPDVSAHVVDSFLHPNGGSTRHSRLDVLTNRERGILQLIAEGRTNRSAAEFLSVSPKTVEKHRSSLMHKLGLRSAAELTLIAIDLGLIQSPLSSTWLSRGHMRDEGHNGIQDDGVDPGTVGSASEITDIPSGPAERAGSSPYDANR